MPFLNYPSGVTIVNSEPKKIYPPSIHLSWGEDSSWGFLVAKNQKMFHLKNFIMNVAKYSIREENSPLLLQLTQFWPMFPFYTLLKHYKTNGFLVFSGSIKWEHWPGMGYGTSYSFSFEFSIFLFNCLIWLCKSFFSWLIFLISLSRVCCKLVDSRFSFYDTKKK